MATSMIDRYRKILDADPASMVFVELAKALLDQGRLDEAISICRGGLEHHPDSIVGHVLWGRALIDLGRPDEAMDQFDKAMAIDPDNPYAYNLIGEALLHRRLYRSALPVLRRAVSLQPGDRRVRQWLAQAEKAAGDGEGGGAPAPTAMTEPTVADTAAAFDSAFDQVAASSSSSAPADEESTDVSVDALAVTDGLGDFAFPSEPSEPSDLERTQVVQSLAEAEDEADHSPGDGGGMGAGGDRPDWPGMPPSEPEPPAEQPRSEEASHPEWQRPSPGYERPDGMGSEPRPEGEDAVLAGMTATFQALEDRDAEDPYPEMDAPKVIASPEVGEQGGDWSEPEPEHAPEPEPPREPEQAPLAPPPLPPGRAAGERRAEEDPVAEVFGLELPPLPGESQAPPETESPEEPEEDPGVAEALAAEYERELREEMIAPEDDPNRRRRTKRIVMGGGSFLAVATAVVAFAWVTVTGREEAVRTGLDSARNGIARDTHAGYLAALERLSDVLRIDGENVEGLALAAAAEAILFSELDPSPERRGRAQALLEKPEIQAAHPDLWLDARYHLADADQREEIAAEVLAALEEREDSATLHYLAGLHHLSSGETEEATEHFSEALEIQPGHARTVLALGNHFAGIDRWEDALTYYDNARTNYPGHGRAEIGAAAARLELDREVDEALADILALEAEHAEGLAESELLRLNVVAARLQHRTGATDDAVRRLREAMSAHPEAPDLPLLLAKIHLERNDLSAALEAARRARSLAPEDDGVRRVEARIHLSWSRYDEAAELLDAIEEPDRRTSLERAIVAYHAGDYQAARRALDAARNEEGQMLADAAIYLALVDLATGEPRAARTVLNRAAQARGADLLVEWALGRWHMDQGNARPARHHLGNAVEASRRHFRSHTDLASLEVLGGAHDQALVHLAKALEANAYFREARQMMGDAHLALGEAEPARDAFKRVLEHHPEDPSAHRGMTLALIELGNVEEAETHARAAVEHGRQEAGGHHALGLVLLAKGEAAEAVGALVQARRRNPDDADILSDLALAHLERGRAADRRHAKRYLEQAVEKDASHGVAHWRLGVVLLRERDIRNSIRSLNRAVAQLRRAGDDQLAAALIDLSRAQLEGGGRRGLERARQAAVQSVGARDTAEGREQLALVYLEQGRPVLARRQLEQAVALDADRAMSHFYLGRILAEAGEEQASRDALERALSLAPRGGHVREARRILSGLGD